MMRYRISFVCYAKCGNEVDAKFVRAILVAAHLAQDLLSSSLEVGWWLFLSIVLSPKHERLLFNLTEGEDESSYLERPSVSKLREGGHWICDA